MVPWRSVLVLGWDARVLGCGSSSGSLCPRPGSGPTEHQGTITGTETWTADTSPHILPNGVSVTGTLTIAPCAEVLIGAGQSISVAATARLVAEGTAAKPIHIGASDPTRPFGQIAANGGGTLRLAYATIDDGGDPGNSVLDVAGSIHAQGADQTAPAQEAVFVDHVTVARSKSNGLYFEDGAGFATGSQHSSTPTWWRSRAPRFSSTASSCPTRSCMPVTAATRARQASLLAACAIFRAMTDLTPSFPEPAPLGIPIDTARALCALAARVPPSPRACRASVA